MMALPYGHTPLRPGHIRLLELLPNDHQLEGRIGHYHVGLRPETNHRDINLVPRYHALSHHWDPRPRPGDKLPRLVIKGEEGDCWVSLRPNLHAALVVISRKALTHGWLSHIWVDAICIDQLSSHDQEQQLSMIGRIYSQAVSVIVWIGKPDPITVRGMSFIKQIQDRNKFHTLLRGRNCAEDWKALAFLARQASFKRRWIIQEIAAAKDITLLSGDEWVSWETFADALSMLMLHAQTTSAALLTTGASETDLHMLRDIACSGASMLVETRAAVLRKRANGDIAEHLQPMEALLTSLSLFEVAKPHDAVFALLWLSSDTKKDDQATQDLHCYKRRRVAPVSLSSEPEDSNQVIKCKRMTSRGSGVNEPRPTKGLVSNAARPKTSTPRNQAGSTHQKNGVHRDQASTSPVIRIDYQQSVFELCRQVLEHVITATQSLDIICFPWAPRPQRQNQSSLTTRTNDEEPHPSWLLTAKYKTYADHQVVPQFDKKVHRRDHADPIVGTPGARERPYRACGDTRATGVRITGRILHSAGYALATITDTAETAYASVIPNSWREKLGWTNTSESPPDHFWRTLVADKGLYDRPPPVRFRLACKWAFERGVEDHELDLKAIREKSEDGIDAPLIEFLDRAIATTWDRKLFSSTSNGASSQSRLIGIGPSTAQVGDIICILLGCSVPVLLRPGRSEDQTLSAGGETSFVNAKTRRQKAMSQSVDSFTFIGECFVHAQMNGECFEYADIHGIPRREFHIR